MRRCARQARSWAREGGARWTADEKTVAAVAHAVGQIGELVRRVSTATRAAHPGIQWAPIAGMRDRIFHDYGHLDRDVLDETVRRDLPELDRQLAAILAGAEGRAATSPTGPPSARRARRPRSR
jgi:uncharacterized protein with HEPN domain